MDNSGLSGDAHTGDATDHHYHSAFDRLIMAGMNSGRGGSGSGYKFKERSLRLQKNIMTKRRIENVPNVDLG